MAPQKYSAVRRIVGTINRLLERLLAKLEAARLREGEDFPASFIPTLAPIGRWRFGERTYVLVALTGVGKLRP